LHEEEGRRQGLRVHYQRIDLARAPAGAESLRELIRAARVFGFAGLNVTYPCKQAVIPLLDSLADEARAIGAVNTIVIQHHRLIGHNTDGAGWSWGWRRALPAADLSRVVLIGAGGAGSACADAVLRLGARELVIHDREPARAAALMQRLNALFEGARVKAATDLRAALGTASGVIHATPTGMGKNVALPLEEQWLRRGMWVSDIVYVPLETPLLVAARRAGCDVIDGGHMNVGQAALAFELFTGLAADAQRMDDHFRRLARTAGASPWT
jgi:shikimate dehydrogenase